MVPNRTQLWHCIPKNGETKKKKKVRKKIKAKYEHLKKYEAGIGMSPWL
jgi:hypothetical protein